jgi:putative ABC transport system permease protein
MLKHILSVFYRNVLRSKLQLVTVVVGLSIGITVSLLIYLYVSWETSYDKHHTDANRIFRINTTLVLEGKTDNTAKAGLNTGEALMEIYPEIESFTQILNINKQTIQVDDNLYASESVIYADSNFFTFFTYAFIAGNPAEALLKPNSAVISDAVAKAYFGGHERALGKAMKVNNVDFEITGVYRTDGSRTHIYHDIFLSLNTLPQAFLAQRNREYMWLTTYNYIKLKAGASIDQLRDKIKTFHESTLVDYVKKNEVNGSITLAFEPVAHIHPNPALRFDLAGAVNPLYIRVFTAVAILTLLIALINYVNLTTAWISKRFKEIGIKKSVGASRASLAFQFVGESVLAVAISYALALVMLAILLPNLNGLVGRSMSLLDILTPHFLLYSALFVLVFGLLVGVYPAILLSALKPIQTLKSATRKGASGFMEKVINPVFVRKVLVTFQFSISIFLIIATLVVFSQFSFLRDRGLGFNKDQILVIDIPTDTAVSNQLDVIKNSLAMIPEVKFVSATASVPGTHHGALTMNVSQTGGSEIKVINTYFADENFLKTLDIELATGRFFSREFSTDPQQAFVLNEAAVKFLGWTDNPLDKKVVSPLGQSGTVVGVIKDFNYKSLHSEIEPLIIMNVINSQGFLMVRISTDRPAQTIEKIREAWMAFDPSHPYDYFFLDEKLQQQYVKEENLTRIFTYFSSIAILISCLGLIGLAVFTHESKVKEIGIRKVLGASHTQIFGMLSSNFLLLVLLANGVAWPLSYYLVNNWLQEFAYRISLTFGPFIMGMLAALGIAFITLAYFAWKASRQNIVQALKYE